MLTRLFRSRAIAIAAGSRAGGANKTSPAAVARLMPLSHFDARGWRVSWRGRERLAVVGLLLPGLRRPGLLRHDGLDVGRLTGDRLRPLAEERPALRRQLRLLPDHAGSDGIDVRDELAAQAHRIRRAGLLLLRRVGEACARLDQNGQRKREACESQGCLQAKRRHRSPQMSSREGVWV